MMDFLLRGRVLTPTRPTILGEDQALLRIDDGCVAVKNGRIERVNSWNKLEGTDAARVIDMRDYLLTPGLVDPHTHIIYAGNRSSELYMKIEGMGYSEIAKRGGGILNTVHQTRSAPEDELFSVCLNRIRRMIRTGVTTIEAKTGYALTLEGEIKCLKLINRLSQRAGIRVVRTLLSAHAVPPEFEANTKGYIEAVVKPSIDIAKKDGLSDFVDVFCEPGYFGVSESREILEYASSQGFQLKLHADEFQDTGGSLLAAELGAVSADHLARSSGRGLVAMAGAGVVGVILPLLFHYSMTKPPEIDKFRAAGLCVAIGTDTNPNSPSESMLLALNHSVYSMRLRPDEALCSGTINAARALGLSQVGALRAGFSADICAFNADNEADLVMRAGVPPLVTSFSEGRETGGFQS